MPSKATISLLLCFVLQACGGASPSVDENGKPTLDVTGYQDPIDAKADGVGGRAGLSTDVDNSSTAVWTVRNAWADTDTPSARAAGIAWPANSGLTWDDKYRAWVDSMAKTDRTLMLTTPWGKELAGPALECAELSMFLRIAFASWYELPFFMEAKNGRERVFFGHFGIRTLDGTWRTMPSFRSQYADHSDQAAAFVANQVAWPSDSALRARSISGAKDDAQPALGGVPAGAYFDEIFLNKRVGYFLLIQLAYQGSMHLADSANTFNLEPKATRPGDSLVLRWQAQGIGHTYVVKEHRETGPDSMELEVMSSSMPRQQPYWESAASSSGHFTNENAGGPEYVQYGGGIKRWRVANAVQGRWTNVVLPQEALNFIPTTAPARLQERPELFERLIVPRDPQERVAGLLEQLEIKREHLRNHPSSCSARSAREDVFQSLYDTSQELGMNRAEVDEAYRELEDYVFSELVYNHSKTCCWNSTTPQMYEIIMDFNDKRIKDDGCDSVEVFMANHDNGDGYAQFRAYAERTGRGADWVAWSADEACPQAGVQSDTRDERPSGDACDVLDSGSFWDWFR